MLKEGLIEQLKATQHFFQTSSSVLAEADSTFAPTAGMLTAAQQIAHSAQSIAWFIDGAFSPTGFDLNFEQQMQPVLACQSLQEARQQFERAIKKAIDAIQNASDAELMAPLPAGPIMGGAPRMAVISALADHTAHHRGALTVYSRLLGKVPPMPYGEA